MFNIKEKSSECMKNLEKKKVGIIRLKLDFQMAQGGPGKKN